MSMEVGLLAAAGSAGGRLGDGGRRGDAGPEASPCSAERVLEARVPSRAAADWLGTYIKATAGASAHQVHCHL